MKKSIITFSLLALSISELFSITYGWNSGTYSSTAQPSTYDQNNSPVQTRTKFFWYPDRGAFRAGVISNNFWDYTSSLNNLGDFSVAFGYNSIAKGKTSFAMGEWISGYGIPTNATGDSSFAFGSGSQATGKASFAFGKGTYYGDFTSASADHSFAFGSYVNVSGLHSAAFGGSVYVAGKQAFAAGLNAQVLSPADYAVSIGFSTSAQKRAAVSLGYDTTAAGESSFAMGTYTNAKGDYSVAMGIATLADDNADPANPSTKSRINAAFGWSTIARGTASFVVGQNNDTSIFTPNPDDINRPLFVVGNGIWPTSTSNAFIVKANGDVVIPKAQGDIAMGEFQ